MTSINHRRRTVLKGATWAVPTAVAAISAPVLAASPCPPADHSAPFRASGLDRASATSAHVTASAGVAGATPVSLSIEASASGSKTLGIAQNLLPSDHLNSNGGSNLGGLGATGLQLQQSGGSASYESRQTVTFTFDRPVSALSFHIVDIDRTGSYFDHVALTGAPSIVHEGSVTGAGTPTDPLRTTLSSADLRPDDGRGNVEVSYSSELTSFSVDFWSGRGTGGQQVFITDFTFTAATC